MCAREPAVGTHPATREAEYRTLAGAVCDDVSPVEPTEPTTGVAEVGRRTRADLHPEEPLCQMSSSALTARRGELESRGDAGPDADLLQADGQTGADKGSLL